MFQPANSFYWLENVTLIVWNVMPPEKFNIFLLK
jgi:hypothetical protein